MMKCLLVLALVFSSIALSSSSSLQNPSLSRKLEDSDSNDSNNDDEGQNYDNDDASGNSGGSDDGSYTYGDDDDGTNVVTRAKERFNEDMAGMWTTSPGNWGEEYWEVFGVLLAATFGILLCFGVVCCAPICYFPNRHGKLATTDMDQSNEPPSFIPGTALQMTVATKAIDAKSATASKESTTTNTNNNTAPNSTMNRPREKKQRMSLWSEFVTVWSEFLCNKTEGTRRTNHSNSSGNRNNGKYEAPYSMYSYDTSEVGTTMSGAGSVAPSLLRRTKVDKTFNGMMV